jgi:hypothetical protein
VQVQGIAKRDTGNPGKRQAKKGIGICFQQMLRLASSVHPKDRKKLVRHNPDHPKYPCRTPFYLL